MFLLALIFTPELPGLMLGLFVVVLIYLFSALPVKFSWNGIKRAIPFLIILGIIQIIFSTPSPTDRVLWTVFGIHLTINGMVGGLILITRFIILISFINALVMILSTSQITSAIFYLLKPLEKIRFPVNDLTMVVQITLRYLPLVAQLAEKITKAQAARGGDWEQKGFNPIRQAKRVLPIIIPIFVTSLRRAETMAVAMESRGFNAANQRSSFYQLLFNWQDALLICVTLILSAATLFAGSVL